jgi:hypothetical protein
VGHEFSNCMVPLILHCSFPIDRLLPAAQSQAPVCMPAARMNKYTSEVHKYANAGFGRRPRGSGKHRKPSLGMDLRQGIGVQGRETAAPEIAGSSGRGKKIETIVGFRRTMAPSRCYTLVIIAAEPPPRAFSPK